MQLSFDSLAGLLAACVVFMLVRWCWPSRRSSGVPQADPSLPLLGNALAFKADSPAFLRDNAARLGPVFELNLAGFRLVLIGDDATLIKQYFRAGEARLSSYQALADVGFADALGHFNVFEAPSIFRTLLREMPAESFRARFEASIASCVRRSISTTVDWLPTVRHWFLVAIVDAMVGDEFLQASADFVDRFQRWQDEYEEAVAKCFVAPRFARPWIMRPIARGRIALRDTLASFVGARRGATCEPDFLACLISTRSDDSDAKLADAMISLLTAAPKNTSIAFANMLMFTHDAPDEPKLRLSDPKVLNSCLTATLRLTNLAIGSVRVVVNEPLVLSSASGVEYVLPVGTRVGASHLLRSCPQPVDFATMLRDDAPDSLAFSGGLHLCPGAKLAFEMAAAATRAWIAARAAFAANAPPKPPLCFQKATLAQRRGPWLVQLVSQ
jgi:cytochrome P450